MFRCCLMVLSAMTIPGLLWGNLVNNGDFETGNLTGWTMAGCNGSVSNVNAHAGAYSYVDVTPTGNSCSLSQGGLATTQGTTYTISFFLRFESPQSPNTNHFQVMFDGVVLNSLDNINSGFAHFIHTRTVSGGPQLQVLDFQFSTSGRGTTWRLDDVQIEAVTPEPSGIVLFGVGGLALMGWRARRKSALVSSR